MAKSKTVLTPEQTYEFVRLLDSGVEIADLSKRYKLTRLQGLMLAKEYKKAREQEQKEEEETIRYEKNKTPLNQSIRSKINELSKEVAEDITGRWEDWSSCVASPLLLDEMSPYDGVMVRMSDLLVQLKRCNRGDELDSDRIRHVVKDIACCCVMAMNITDTPELRA